MALSLVHLVETFFNACSTEKAKFLLGFTLGMARNILVNMLITYIQYEKHFPNDLERRFRCAVTTRSDPFEIVLVRFRKKIAEEQVRSCHIEKLISLNVQRKPIREKSHLRKFI